MKIKKEARILSPYTLLTYLMVITFVLTGVSFARFGNTKTADDAAKAAIFEIETVSAPNDQLVQVYHSEDGEKTCGNYVFKVKSTSEVPVTYTIMTDTTGGDVLNYGIELTLTAVTSDEVRQDALEGKHTPGLSHIHRPDGTKTIHIFGDASASGGGGVAAAPAGTHTQEFVLNFHYTEAGKAGADTTVPYKIWDGIKIKVIARDARHKATYGDSEGESHNTNYTTPYTPAN